MSLSEEQRSILGHFEGLELDFCERGINEVYLRDIEAGGGGGGGGGKEWVDEPIATEI